jgi:hypothetical protein
MKLKHWAWDRRTYTAAPACGVQLIASLGELLFSSSRIRATIRFLPDFGFALFLPFADA